MKRPKYVKALHITPLQVRCMVAIKQAPSRNKSVSDLARQLKTSRVAVYSAIKSLQAQALIGLWRRGESRGAALMCFLTRKGESHDAAG